MRPCCTVQIAMKKPSPRSLALLSFAALAACARHSGDIAGVVIGSVPRFETRIEIPTGTGTHSDYFLADFDGDTLLDMAVISLTGELRILQGNGTTFVLGQELMIGGLPIWMSGGDFDNDGDQDLVIVRSVANSTDLWLNDGNATFTAGASLPVGTDALAVTVGDFDNDQNLDVAVSRPGAPEIYIGTGGGNGAFLGTQQIALPGGGQAFNITAGDATGDGLCDLIVADPTLDRVLVLPQEIYPNPGLGSVFCQLDVPGAPAAIALGDLSGDGQADLTIACFAANKYRVVTNIDFGGEGTAGPGVQIYSYTSFDVNVPNQPSLATIADVTGDGLADLCACLAFNATMCVAKGRRVLDLFCYQGAFARNAMRGGAVSALAVDQSESALAIATADAERDGLPLATHHGNVFDLLRTQRETNTDFDLVVLDPPAFAKSRREIEGAERGYRDLNRQALRVLAPNGFLVTCTCSHHMGAARFEEVVRQAAAGLPFHVVVRQRLGAGPDHPVPITHPESEYLKVLLLQRIDPA